MRVFRVLDFVGVALMLGFLGAAAVVRFKDLEMRALAFGVAHLLASSLVLMSFLAALSDTSLCAA
jgi:multisubunit Na+/H+ antiporter MnhG subunit